ncbi:MAG TPA: DUF2335 domain-containing protein [Longimicrobium sp.]|nr:DUF2335 domain-containing protein [Longimicrobium sp.]
MDVTTALREMAAAHRSIRQLAGVDGVNSPPDTVREYGDVLPGLALRIVDWAEREAEHRRAMERSLLRLSWAGLWCALAVTLVTISGGMLLALQGRSTAGLAGIVGAVAALVIVFVAGRRQVSADSVPAQETA